MGQHCSRTGNSNWNSILTTMNASMPSRFATPEALSDASFGAALFRPFNRAASQTPVERPDLSGVKGTVNRARWILASLLPALWLVLSATYHADSVYGSPSNPSASSVLDAGHAKQDTSCEVFSFEESARRWSRRHDDRPGGDGFSTPVVVAQFQLPKQEAVSALQPEGQPLSGLAKCWQFRWRTALEPRAPTSAS